ncbi:aromatic amino acid lyase|uniref:Aromatic amino acid lyase n=1 Tax=Dendrosporobacter quercicolus TaxID=146817 RepID=A0A1G9VYI5_9FIRM|nr:aromatic amino acid ammonia-lyase [Dendrosporobacter quercicolus]NSL47772.1 aromatic amino acid lyase [Dendrosporobacter quercicolus DSM 1736]SDM77011.1 Aromatic amino acid lyase [Dendrosporobacter quercicolus]
MKTIYINGNSLTIEEYHLIVKEQAIVALDEDVKKRVKKSADYLEDIFNNNKIMYGITTGVGAFKDKIISGKANQKLQENIIMAHLVGVGEHFSRQVVRGAMLIKANSVAKGYHGVRVSILETLLALLNNQVHPVVPQKGSVGATGDLIPGAYIIEVMIGRGKAEYKGQILDAAQTLQEIGISPVQLNTREGKALTVGTSVMTAVAALNVYEAHKILKVADIAAALSTEGMKCITEALDPRIQETRPFHGQINTAENCKKLLVGSELIWYTNKDLFEILEKIAKEISVPEFDTALKGLKSQKSYTEIYNFLIMVNEDLITNQQIKVSFSKLKTVAGSIQNIFQARSIIQETKDITEKIADTALIELGQCLKQYLDHMIGFCELIQRLLDVNELKKDQLEQKIGRTRIAILINSLFQLPKGPESYTIRCIPQVSGPAKDAWNFIKEYVEIEMNCANDFTQVFPEADVCLTGGNFHGQTIAMAMDFLKIAVAALGSISERRVFKMLDRRLNEILPANLLSRKSSESGLNLGLTYIQFTAAALVSENKILCHPAAADSIPTASNSGDHVSMGTIAARKAQELIENLWYILAIEFICACQGIDLRFEEFDCKLKLGNGTGIAYTEFRKGINKLEEDGIEIGLEIEKAKKMIRSEQFIQRIEDSVGVIAI